MYCNQSFLLKTLEKSEQRALQNKMDSSILRILNNKKERALQKRMESSILRILSNKKEREFQNRMENSVLRLFQNIILALNDPQSIFRRFHCRREQYKLQKILFVEISEYRNLQNVLILASSICLNFQLLS